MFNIDRKRPCCGARPGAVEPVLFSINERSCRAGAEWRRGLPATPPTSARCAESAHEPNDVQEVASCTGQ
jgi:hypothetical protein